MKVIEQILAEVKKLEIPISEKSHPKMIADYGQRIRNAENRIKELKLAYGVEIASKGLFILVAGENADSASSQISQTMKLPTFHADTFFDKFKNHINKQNYIGKNFNSTLVAMLNQKLMDEALAMDVVSAFNAMVLKNNYVRAIKTKEEFDDLITTILTSEQGSSEILAIQAALALVDYGIREKFDGDMMPVVIWSKDSRLLEMQKHLQDLGKGCFTIFVGDSETNPKQVELATTVIKTASATSITNAFKAIKNKLKGNKKS